jgi:hypothetical protein
MHDRRKLGSVKMQDNLACFTIAVCRGSNREVALSVFVEEFVRFHTEAYTFTFNMSSEDIARPLMGEEEGLTEKEDWHWDTYHLPIYQKKPAARTIFFYSFIALPWLLLAGLGFWSLPSLRIHGRKTGYYIAPELAYSKSSLHESLCEGTD